MSWLLFAIILEAEQYYVKAVSAHKHAAECYAARDRMLATAPKPKINYEIVCIATDRVTVL